MTELNFPDNPTIGDIYFGENGIIYEYVGDNIWEIKESSIKTLNRTDSSSESLTADFWFSKKKGQILLYDETDEKWEFLLKSGEIEYNEDYAQPTKFGNVDVILDYPTFNTSKFSDYDYTKYYNDVFTQNIETSGWLINHSLKTKEIKIITYDENENYLNTISIYSSDNIIIGYPSGVSYEVPTVVSVNIINSQEVIVSYNEKTKGYAFIEPLEEYPEKYGINEKILSTHYKVNFEYNTNPFDDDYIISKSLMNDLYNKWEEFRPITRVSYYTANLDIPVDFSGNDIPLYEDADYDANLYSTTALSSNNCEDAFIYQETVSKKIWNVEHDLNTRNVIVKSYISNEYSNLEEIVPKNITIEGRNSLIVEFDEETRGYVCILASDYNEDQDSIIIEQRSWEIIHDLGSQNILYETYDEAGRKIIPSDFEILDNDRAKITFSNKVPGKCIIKNVENSTYYHIYQQPVTNPLTTWTITHNLGSKNIIFKVYDGNNKAIWPKTAITTSNNSLELTFNKPIYGKCVIEKAENYTTFVSSYGDLYANHELNTTNLIFDVYDDNDKLLMPDLTYDKQEGSDEDLLYLKFSSDVHLENARCVVLNNADYVHVNKWIVNHNLDQKYVISQIYSSENNYIVSPDNINIIDESSFKVDLKNILGKAQVAGVIKDANYCEPGHGKIYTQLYRSDTWIIDHNLNNLCIVLDVYDDNDEKIFPSNYELELINENRCKISFGGELKSGHCVIRSIGNTPGPIIKSFKTGVKIILKAEGITNDIITNNNFWGSSKELSDRIEVSFSIPKGTEGYFNKIEIYNNKDLLCFESWGDPIYKHKEFIMNYKYIIYYEDIY